MGLCATGAQSPQGDQRTNGLTHLSNLTAEETRPERKRNLPKVTQQIKDRGKIQLSDSGQRAFQTFFF